MKLKAALNVIIAAMAATTVGAYQVMVADDGVTTASDTDSRSTSSQFMVAPPQSAPPAAITSGWGRVGVILRDVTETNASSSGLITSTIANYVTVPVATGDVLAVLALSSATVAVAAASSESTAFVDDDGAVVTVTILVMDPMADATGGPDQFTITLPLATSSTLTASTIVPPIDRSRVGSSNPSIKETNAGTSQSSLITTTSSSGGEALVPAATTIVVTTVTVTWPPVAPTRCNSTIIPRAYFPPSF